MNAPREKTAEPGRIDVRARQEPLRARYRDEPGEALITDRARTTGGAALDAFHGEIVPGSEDYGVLWKFGIHRAIGGDHDLPNPGDLLCAALAACLDSTLRILADRLGVGIVSLSVEVDARIDVRGTLVVDRSVPVGFQAMRCRVRLETGEGVDPGLVQKLLAAAEHSCVNLATLRSGVSVEASYEIGPDGAAAN